MNVGMNSFEVCYSQNDSALMIVNRNQNVAYKKTSNYGIEIGYNVYGEPISFVFPEPEIIFGVPTSDFLKIQCVVNN